MTSPDEQGVQLRFGSDDKAKVWLNGEEVFTHIKSDVRGIDQHVIPVSLEAGENSILVKVCDETASWGFYLRFTDTNGKPFLDLELTEDTTSK